MKTREQIIADMCYTWRHDYGIVKTDEDILSSGMTLSEKELLWKSMAQLFDNCIAPHVYYNVPNSKNICDND